MYAFAIAVAIERLPLEVVAPPNSTLMAQPPADLTLGRSAMVSLGCWSERACGRAERSSLAP